MGNQFAENIHVASRPNLERVLAIQRRSLATEIPTTDRSWFKLAMEHEGTTERYNQCSLLKTFVQGI